MKTFSTLHILCVLYLASFTQEASAYDVAFEISPAQQMRIKQFVTGYPGGLCSYLLEKLNESNIDSLNYLRSIQKFKKNRTLKYAARKLAEQQGDYPALQFLFDTLINPKLNNRISTLEKKWIPTVIVGYVGHTFLRYHNINMDMLRSSNSNARYELLKILVSSQLQNLINEIYQTLETLEGRQEISHTKAEMLDGRLNSALYQLYKVIEATNIYQSDSDCTYVCTDTDNSLNCAAACVAYQQVVAPQVQHHYMPVQQTTVVYPAKETSSDYDENSLFYRNDPIERSSSSNTSQNSESKSESSSTALNSEQAFERIGTFGDLFS